MALPRLREFSACCSLGNAYQNSNAFKPIAVQFILSLSRSTYASSSSSSQAPNDGRRQQLKSSPLSSSLKTQKSRSSSKSRTSLSRSSMGADGTVAASAAPATHAPVKRLSQQSSGGNSPSALSVSVPTGSKMSSYALEDIREQIQLIIRLLEMDQLDIRA